MSGGLILSIILMVILASLCLVAFQILVKAQQKIGGSYGDVAEHLYGPYLIFISENIGIVVNTLNNCNAPFEPKYYIWIVLAVIIPLCWVRKIARLSWVAIIADVFIAFGLICILYFTSDQIAHHGVGKNIIMVNSEHFGLMIGTAVFSYEGIGMVLPIVEGMKNPEKFPQVLTLGMIICSSVFTLIGAIGYIAYGDITQASIVANVPRGPLAVTVQLLYAIAMILTSPFMLYPPLTIIEKYIFGSRSGKVNFRIKMSKNFVRSLIALVCAAVSFGVGSANLSKFVALVGSVACMPLCFIFPGLFHYKTTTNRKARILDILLILWGVGIMVFTSTYFFNTVRLFYKSINILFAAIVYVNVNSWVHPVDILTTILADECSV